MVAITAIGYLCRSATGQQTKVRIAHINAKTVHRRPDHVQTTTGRSVLDHHRQLAPHGHFRVVNALRLTILQILAPNGRRQLKSPIRLLIILSQKRQDIKENYYYYTSLLSKCMQINYFFYVLKLKILLYRIFLFWMHRFTAYKKCTKSNICDTTVKIWMNNYQKNATPPFYFESFCANSVSGHSLGGWSSLTTSVGWSI